MASLLYMLLCTTLAASAAFELRTRNRPARIQTWLTLLGALVFCGFFALLVSAAQLANGAYQTAATAGFLVLTGASLYTLARFSRRFRALPASRNDI